MKTVAAGMVFCALATAQITNLSTDESGSQLYFSTMLRFRGSDQLFTPKLFRLGPAGLELVEQRQPQYMGARSNDYILFGRDLSADGTTYVTNRRASCSGGSACVFFETRYSEFVTPTSTYKFSGAGQVSANGRWGITCCGTGFSLDPSIPVRSVLRVDLQSGQRTAMGLPPAAGGHWVASDATIFVTRGNNAYVLAGLDNEVAVPLSEPLDWAVLSDDGQTLAWQTSSKGEIWTWTKGSSAPQFVGPGSRPSLSYDGRRLAWLGTDGQVWSCYTVACNARSVTSEDAGVREVVMVGNGGEVLLITGDNRIVVVDVGNGFRAEYLGPAPEIHQQSPSTAVPGSSGWMSGVFPDGAEIRVRDQPLTILSASKDQISYQAPWELAVDPSGVRTPVILWAGDVVWEAQAGSGVAPFAPFSPRIDEFSFAAIHEDWHGWATDTDPAKPGEILHLFLGGLGAVSPPIATGAASPVSPLSRTTLPLTWSSQSGPVEVLFAGAAPGLVGIYQVDFRIPRDWATNWFSLTVSLAGADGENSVAFVAVQ